jgi:hypothetical protein
MEGCFESKEIRKNSDLALRLNPVFENPSEVPIKGNLLCGVERSCR